MTTTRGEGAARGQFRRGEGGQFIATADGVRLFKLGRRGDLTVGMLNVEGERTGGQGLPEGRGEFDGAGILIGGRRRSIKSRRF